MEGKPKKSALATGQDSSHDVQEERRSCGARLKDANPSGLFDYEEAPAPIFCVCQKYRFGEIGQEGSQGDARHLCLNRGGETEGRKEK